MYRKWDQTKKLSRADWIVLSHYVQIGCEEPSDDPRLPRPESFATVILAFLAVRRLRTNPVSDLDHFFLGNLESPSGQSLRIPDGSAPSEYVPTVCREILDVLQKPDSKLRPVFVGRNLHVALRDERGGGIEAINQELQQFWTTLWHLAARGHWLREKRPIRPSRPDLSFRAAAPVPPVEVKEFRLSVVTTQHGDIAMLLEMLLKHISYPLSPYPTIREFATMVSQLQPGKPWHGSQFSGVTHGQGRKVQFLFRDRGNGITIDFSEAEWNSMGELFENIRAWPEAPRLLLIERKRGIRNDNRNWSRSQESSSNDTGTTFCGRPPFKGRAIRLRLGFTRRVRSLSTIVEAGIVNTLRKVILRGPYMIGQSDAAERSDRALKLT